MQRVTGLRTGWLLSAAAILIGGWSMPAAAADLGGDCCADLEERIAELEATTARKGNRKVSLTVSGWVNEAVFFWDDGNERNVYVGTNFVEQSRVRFLGEAKINADWSAGYILEIGVCRLSLEPMEPGRAWLRKRQSLKREQRYQRSQKCLVPQEQGLGTDLRRPERNRYVSSPR